MTYFKVLVIFQFKNCSKIIRKYPILLKVDTMSTFSERGGCSEKRLNDRNYDICTQKFLENLKKYPFNHIAEIAHETRMQRRLVCDIVADLIHYEMCTVTSIFQYSNRYRVSGNIRLLYQNKNLQKLLLDYVTKVNHGILDGAPKISDLFKVLKEFNNDVTVKRVLSLSHLHKILTKVDIKKLVHAANAYGILIRLYDFPVTDNYKLTCTISSEDTGVDPLFDGSVHFDEILVNLASVENEDESTKRNAKSDEEEVVEDNSDDIELKKHSYRSLKKQILRDAPDTEFCIK